MQRSNEFRERGSVHYNTVQYGLFMVRSYPRSHQPPAAGPAPKTQRELDAELWKLVQTVSKSAGRWDEMVDVSAVEAIIEVCAD